LACERRLEIKESRTALSKDCIERMSAVKVLSQRIRNQSLGECKRYPNLLSYVPYIEKIKVGMVNDF